jgi:UDP-N-acetyl-2-amino-2-deoxyglucuronate dehydrogenase
MEKEKSGGGPMMDFGCHRIEVLMNLFGAIRQVEGVTSNLAFKREVEDTAAAVLRFESGCCATITITHAAIEPRDTLDVYGTEGSIHIPVLNKAEMAVIVGDSTRTESHPTAANTHQPLINDFTEAVLNGRKPEIDGEIGKQVNSIIEQIYRGNTQSAVKI